jgi:serine/threonine protein phosphatase 1
LPGERRPPSLPDGVRVYAVGDLHGRADLLRDLVPQIELDLVINPVAKAIVIFLGDYIDRGPASRQVIELLVELEKSLDVIFLKGNHESFALDFLDNPDVLDRWRNYGGLETLLSYGLTPSIRPTQKENAELARAFAATLPESHHRFLTRLKTSFSCGDFFFVHAGVRPGVPLEEQREEDLLWIRNEFLVSEIDFGKIVVHGHEPVDHPEIRFNRINIDTGAFATGRLTCLIIERELVWGLTDKHQWARRFFEPTHLPNAEAEIGDQPKMIGTDGEDATLINIETAELGTGHIEAGEELPLQVSSVSRPAAPQVERPLAKFLAKMGF